MSEPQVDARTAVTSDGRFCTSVRFRQGGVRALARRAWLFLAAPWVPPAPRPNRDETLRDIHARLDRLTETQHARVQEFEEVTRAMELVAIHLRECPERHCHLRAVMAQALRKGG